MPTLPKLVRIGLPQMRKNGSTVLIDSDKDEIQVDTTKARISSRVPKPARAVRERFIHLSRRDAEVYLKALRIPPSLSARLKQAVAAYKRSSLNVQD